MAAEAQHGNSPEPFLETQCEVFGKFRHPNMTRNQSFLLPPNLEDFTEHATNNVDASEHTPANYKRAIHKHHKDSTGSDMWTNTVLREKARCSYL